MPYTHYHPVYLDLKDRRILIVGGGSIALEKLNSLLSSGARITVVSPEAITEIRDWAVDGSLVWEQRSFHSDDVDPYYMVIAATDDPVLNALVYKCGNDKQRLSNSVDDPINCNFIMSAITRRGPMQVAVSSAGCSPALAQRVRNRVMEEILTAEIGELAEFLGDRRSEVKSRLPGYKVRQAFWERVIDSSVPDILSSGDFAGADDLFHEMLVSAVAYAPSDPVLSPPPEVDVRATVGEGAEGRVPGFLATDALSRRQEPSDDYISGRKPVGKVSLVGAGPGDPDLITVKGLKALQAADVVLYDRLVHPDLLESVRPGAERIYVGKEVGHTGKGRQKWINEQLIEHARLGRKVVRLKGGDPFVFGRGGEELVALREAGIEADVIPGISSAVAGPAAAGIPVTHRGVATAFGVFAGHEAEGRDDVPWAAAAKLPTSVFLMGVDRLAHIAERLVSEGRSAQTPVAVISKATCEDQKIVTGVLRDIAQKAEGIPPPAVIVVGDVVRVANRSTVSAFASALL